MMTTEGFLYFLKEFLWILNFLCTPLSFLAGRIFYLFWYCAFFPCYTKSIKKKVVDSFEYFYCIQSEFSRSLFSIWRKVDGRGEREREKGRRKE